MNCETQLNASYQYLASPLCPLLIHRDHNTAKARRVVPRSGLAQSSQRSDAIAKGTHGWSRNRKGVWDLVNHHPLDHWILKSWNIMESKKCLSLWCKSSQVSEEQTRMTWHGLKVWCGEVCIMSCTGVPRLDRLMIKIAPGMKTWCKVRRLGPANGLLQNNCNTKEYKALPEASVQYLWNGLVWLLPVMCFQYLPMLRYLFLRCRPAASATCTLLKTSCDTLPAWPVKATSESN